MQTLLTASNKHLLTASKVTPLIEILYVLFIDKIQGTAGKPDEATTLEINTLARQVLPIWEEAMPALRIAVLSVLQGKRKAEALASLGIALKQVAPLGKGDRGVPAEDLEILTTLGAFFRTDSPIAQSKLIKFASLTKNPWIVQKLAPKVGDQHSTKAALEELIKTLVGRADTALTIAESNQIKATKPDAYAAYLALRKQFNQSWRDALISFVRKSGKDKVPYADVIQYLKLNGIDHLMPSGFTGLIDDLSRLYTNKGEMIDGVPNAVTFPEVTMNPNYGKPDGGDWVFMARRSGGGAGPYFYTSAYKNAQTKAKFSKVVDLSKKMDGMRKRWFAKVRKFDITSPECVAAVILEILYEFSARIGSVGNAAHGQSTYGVGTLLAKHAVLDLAGNVTLKYKGKDGVSTVHKMLRSDPDTKYVLLAVHQMLVNKEPNDRIFTFTKGSKAIPVNAAQVNAYFKACGAPEGVTVHKIRTVAGTKIFTDAMEAALEKRKPKTEREAMDLFKKLAELAGKELNHVRRLAGGVKVTGTTALNAYVDPSVQLLYWSLVGFRIPKYLEKFSDALT